MSAMELEFMFAVVALAGGSIAVIRALVLGQMRQQAAREIAERKITSERWGEIVKTQDKIAVALENHLSMVAKNLAALSEGQALLLDRARRYRAASAKASMRRRR